MTKTYCRDSSTFENVVVGFGSCIASDCITVDGALVGLMYREEPQNELDSGWRFLAGFESDDYANKPPNLGLFDVNTIANDDPAIVDKLDAPFGSTFVRKGGLLILDHTYVTPGGET